MPFRDTRIDAETLKVLVSVYDRVCKEFFVNEDQRDGVARQLIQASMDGITDPDLLRAAAITWIRENRPVEPAPKGDGNGLKAKKR